MPIVKVEIVEGKSKGYKKALLDGVHKALVDTLKIPDYDRIQRLYELSPDNFETVPPNTDSYTIIEITLFKGRTRETRKKLFASLVEELVKSPGIPKTDIITVLKEVPQENWGIRGGQPADEVDLGFDINI